MADLDSEARRFIQNLDRRNRPIPAGNPTKIAMQANGTVVSNTYRILNVQSKVADVREEETNRRSSLIIPGGYLFCIIDGGGQPISPSSKPAASLAIHDNLIVQRWVVIADVAGSIAIDLRRSTYDSYPTVTSIISGAGPSLGGQIKNRVTTDVVGWSQLFEDDILDVIVTASTTVTRVSLKLQVKGVP